MYKRVNRHKNSKLQFGKKTTVLSYNEAGARLSGWLGLESKEMISAAGEKKKHVCSQIRKMIIVRDDGFCSFVLKKSDKGRGRFIILQGKDWHSLEGTWYSN